MKTVAILALILPGLVVAYFLYLRPILRAFPMFKRFYDEADGFWATAWVFCGKSATMVWAFLLQALSWALQAIDPVANFIGDPDLRQQITDGLQANPKVLGYILMGISFLTIAARLRGMVKQSDGE
jgi:hypothetical protein